jgi:hypothetical protein
VKRNRFPVLFRSVGNLRRVTPLHDWLVNGRPVV